MFELEYCSNPEIGELHSSGIKFDYQYDVEFDSKLKTLEDYPNMEVDAIENILASKYEQIVFEK